MLSIFVVDTDYPCRACTNSLVECPGYLYSSIAINNENMGVREYADRE